MTPSWIPYHLAISHLSYFHYRFGDSFEINYLHGLAVEVAVLAVCGVAVARVLRPAQGTALLGSDESGLI